MADANMYDALTRAYANPTKMSILFLLAGNEKMTVTDMAHYVNVSRSNLYHYVSQLVEDGLLNEPEVVPKKNYVEKYYTINGEVFQAVNVMEWTEHLKTLDSSEIKAIISSTLMAQSVQLKMAAENVSKADPKLIDDLSEWMMARPYCMTFSSLSSKSVETAYRYIEGMYDEMAKANQENRNEESSPYGILVISLLPAQLAMLTSK